MKYHVIVSGEGHDCQLFVGFEGKPEGDATAADVIAALKANPEARAEVLDALGEPPASRHLDVAAAIARAEQAERERDQWRAKWEALETTRASCCDQMERERDEARALYASETGKLNLAHAKGMQFRRERDEARYWLAAHKAASEALVDPITGHGFFMLIGKGDDGVDGWFYTFGGPFDSYTLCERSDDEDPHFVYFHRERYDHDQGGWADGVEVVEPVLAPDECSVAPYCLEEVTEERDALKAKLAEAERGRDEARAERDSVLDRLAGAREARDAASDDAEALRAKLARYENVAAEEVRSTAGCEHKSQRCENDRAVCRDCGAVNRAVTGIADWVAPEPAGSSRCPRCIETGLVAGTGEYTRMPCPEYLRGVKVLPCVIGPPLQFDGRGAFDDVPDPSAPATRREVEELRRRVERLESGPRRVG